MGYNTGLWGPLFWSMLYHFAKHNRQENRPSMVKLLSVLHHILPCIYCRRSSFLFVKQIDWSSNDWDVILYTLKNNVNKKLFDQQYRQHEALMTTTTINHTDELFYHTSSNLDLSAIDDQSLRAELSQIPKSDTSHYANSMYPSNWLMGRSLMSHKDVHTDTNNRLFGIEQDDYSHIELDPLTINDSSLQCQTYEYRPVISIDTFKKKQQRPYDDFNLTQYLYLLHYIIIDFAKRGDSLAPLLIFLTSCKTLWRGKWTCDLSTLYDTEQSLISDKEDTLYRWLKDNMKQNHIDFVHELDQ